MPPMWMRGRWMIPLQRSYGSRGEPSPSLMLESAAGTSLRQEDLTRIGLCLLVSLLLGVAPCNLQQHGSYAKLPGSCAMHVLC